LFIDIDGTLVDFAPLPDDVRVDPETRSLLVRLTDLLDGALAVLSGRCLSDVDRVLSPLLLPAGATHGLEVRDATGGVSNKPPLDEIAGRVRLACMKGASSLAGVWVEDKNGVAFALHFRNARSQQDAVIWLAHSIANANAGHYVVQLGDCVAELKPSGSDKGVALNALIRTPPFRDRRPIVIGDDLTDEAAFSAAEQHGGFGIIVGKRRPTQARHALASPQAVLAWLGALAEHLEHPGVKP
jgi:trehalose 6-phosphate phosphatase